MGTAVVANPLAQVYDWPLATDLYLLIEWLADAERRATGGSRCTSMLWTAANAGSDA